MKKQASAGIPHQAFSLRILIFQGCTKFSLCGFLFVCFTYDAKGLLQPLKNKLRYQFLILHTDYGCFLFYNTTDFLFSIYMHLHPLAFLGELKVLQLFVYFQVKSSHRHLDHNFLLSLWSGLYSVLQNSTKEVAVLYDMAVQNCQFHRFHKLNSNDQTSIIIFAPR